MIICSPLWDSFFFHCTSIWIAFHPCLLGISCHLAVCWLIVIFFLASLPNSLHFSYVSSTPADHRSFLSSCPPISSRASAFMTAIDEPPFTSAVHLEFMADLLGFKSFTLNSTEGKIAFSGPDNQAFINALTRTIQKSLYLGLGIISPASVGSCRTSLCFVLILHFLVLI